MKRPYASSKLGVQQRASDVLLTLRSALGRMLFKVTLAFFCSKLRAMVTASHCGWLIEDCEWLIKAVRVYGLLADGCYMDNGGNPRASAPMLFCCFWSSSLAHVSSVCMPTVSPVAIACSKALWIVSTSFEMQPGEATHIQSIYRTYYIHMHIPYIMI